MGKSKGRVPTRDEVAGTALAEPATSRGGAGAAAGTGEGPAFSARASATGKSSLGDSFFVTSPPGKMLARQLQRASGPGTPSSSAVPPQQTQPSPSCIPTCLEAEAGLGDRCNRGPEPRDNRCDRGADAHAGGPLQ